MLSKFTVTESVNHKDEERFNDNRMPHSHYVTHNIMECGKYSGKPVRRNVVLIFHRSAETYNKTKNLER